MGADENRVTIHGLIAESVNRNRPDLLEHFVHPDVVVHPGTPGTVPATEGVEQLRDAFVRFHTVFPDLHIAVEDQVAEGDRVAVRWTATGTHDAALAGVPPTGSTVRWGGIDVYRLAGGKVVEWWRNDDFVGLLKQLGRDALSRP